MSLAALQGARALIVFHPQDETPECLAVVERLNASVPAIESAGASLVTVVVSGPEAARGLCRSARAGAARVLRCEWPDREGLRFAREPGVHEVRAQAHRPGRLAAARSSGPGATPWGRSTWTRPSKALSRIPLR